MQTRAHPAFPALPIALLLLLLPFAASPQTLGPDASLQALGPDVSLQALDPAVETRRVAAEFQHYLEDSMRQYSPGMAVTIVDGHSTSYISTYGIRRLGSPEVVDPHTTFRLASLSKAFAAATAGIVVNEGSLAWDDKLNAYLPAVALKDRRQELISVRHILSNSTGLLPHAYTNMVEDNVPYQRIVEKMNAVDFVCDPGSCYTYQNVAYSFIGDILENVTGKTYPDLVTEKIFTPLQMTDASVTLEEFIGRGNHASPHQRRQRRLTPTEVKGNYYTVAPAAGVNASIADMEQWLHALLGNRPDILPEDVLGELFTPGARVRERGYYTGSWNKVKDTWYGMGWRVFDYAGTQVIYHGGWVQGYHAEIVVVPSLSIGMALLMNSDYTNGTAAVPRFLDIALGLEKPSAILLPN